MNRAWMTALAGLMLAACSGGDDTPSDTPTESAPAQTATQAPETATQAPETATQTQAQPTDTEGTPTASGVDWESMTFQEKQAFMASTVLPQMTALFQAFDDEEFATVTCGTCHGDTDGGAFTMPHQLHPLDPANFPSADSDDPEEAAWASFMMNEVTPKMVELLGVEPYDFQTGEGFGCFSCHPVAP